MTFRIKFAKYGVVRFIGHLDVMRYFQKVIRRSRLPVSYSQGFSPHQLMSFALPLSVGVTSDGEYMEVEFDDEALQRSAGVSADPEGSNSSSGTEASETDPKEAEKLEKYIFDGLAANTTEGFAVLGVKMLPKPKPNTHQDKAMALVSAADYLIRVKDGYEESVGFSTQDDLYSAFERFMARETIEVTKKTKKNENQLNLKEYIYRYTNGDDADAAGIAHARKFGSGMQLMMRLAAGSKVNIKPDLVLEAFLNSIGREFDKNAFAIHRMELFMGEKDELKPLIEC